MPTETDHGAGEPKYYAVKRHLLDFIGSLEPGAPVPTERELATHMDTSRTTVRQALGELVVEGRLVRRRRGSGTYVAEPKITWPLYLASFTEQVQAEADLRPLRRCWVPSGSQPALSSPGAWASALRAPVYRLERLRLAQLLADRRRDLMARGGSLRGPHPPDPRSRFSALGPGRALRHPPAHGRGDD